MATRRKTGHLLTEKINPKTKDIDRSSTEEILGLIIEEDKSVTGAIEKEKKSIAKAVRIVADVLAGDGRIVFVGAGTSGRLGVVEAAECPPTFGVSPKKVQAVIAGGKKAIVRSVEGAEDSGPEAREALSKLGIGKDDVVVGIAASGSTPFVNSALMYAKNHKCRTVLITCNRTPKSAADVVINLLVGPEVIVGSTRMKAGTATKMVLNMITTAAMVKIGKTYGNLMVDLQAKSEKLKDRGVRIVTHLTGIGERKAEKLLEAARWDVKTAIVMAIKDVEFKKAKELVRTHRGFLREIVE